MLSVDLIILQFLEAALISVHSLLATTRCFCSVLVLDEIDSLDSRNQEVLYTMFEWPSLPGSTLILIGNLRGSTLILICELPSSMLVLVDK